MYSRAYYARQRAAAVQGGADRRGWFSGKRGIFLAVWLALVVALTVLPNRERRSLVRTGRLVLGDLNRRLGLADERGRRRNRRRRGDGDEEDGGREVDPRLAEVGTAIEDGGEDGAAGAEEDEPSAPQQGDNDDYSDENDDGGEGGEGDGRRLRRSDSARRRRERRRRREERRTARIAEEAAAAAAAGVGEDTVPVPDKGEPAAEPAPAEQAPPAAAQAQGEEEGHSHEHGHDHGHSHGGGAVAAPPAGVLVAQPPAQLQQNQQQQGSTASPELKLNEHGWPVYAAAPPREPGWAPEQRPLPGSNERLLTSHKFAEASVASMNPPVARDGLPAHVRAELSSRLVIALGQGVHSGQANVDGDGLNALAIFNTMLRTFLPTMQPHHVYRWYFAFDHNDRVFESEGWRTRITAAILKAVDEEDARRWHPPGYSRPRGASEDGTGIALGNMEAQAVDNSALVLSVHWVHCNYHSKPSWAHSDAILASYKEGADYAYRGNDDSKLPETRRDWVDAFILDLRARQPVANLGIVGPACEQGAKHILTHDFTHRTHAVVFGWHYPRSLPDWSSDDWITFVYGQFNPSLTSRREDVPVVHELHGTRYSPSQKEIRLRALNSELAAGGTTIVEWARVAAGASLSFTPKVVECC